jgi:hypothetical protein
MSEVWLIGLGVPVALTLAAFAYGRRPVRTTLTMASTGWLRRGDVFSVGGADDNSDLVIVRRVVSGTTLAVASYAGWRKWAHRARTRWRYRWRRTTGAVHGWFERDDDDDD